MAFPATHKWTSLLVAIIVATVCLCAPAEAKSNSSVKDSHKTSSKTTTKSDKKSSKNSSKSKKSDDKKKKKSSEKKSKKIKIKADDPKAFTKALLYDKEGVEYEIVETKKSPRRATVPENSQQQPPQDSLQQANAPDSVTNENASTQAANQAAIQAQVPESNQPEARQVEDHKSENNGEFFDFSTMLLPITHEALVGSPYGIRSHRLHRGVDVNVIKDEPVVAAYPGVVTMSRYNKGGYGNYVLIKHTNGIETLYAHLSKRLLKVGDEVFPGDIVGLAGNSGRSSAAHLHFEIRYGEVNIDPTTVIDFPHWSLKEGVDQFSMKKATAAHRKIQAKLKNYNYYIVKQGDSQGDVANWFNISIESLCRINNLKPGAPLKAGQKLRGCK